MLAANSQFARMFGYSEDIVLDVHPFGFIAPRERAGIEAFAYCNYEAFGESLGVRANGSVFPIQIIARPVTYKGQDARIVGVCDVTEYPHAQASLDASVSRAGSRQTLYGEHCGRRNKDLAFFPRCTERVGSPH